MARKNPLGAITAFKSAFGPDDEALLLLKVQRGESRPDRLRELKQAANRPGGRVTIVDATWPADQTRALIASSDVVISLHRAEGFGLVIAESMISDVPVIATGWSGNLDFMSPEYPGLVPYRLQPVSDPQGIYRSQAWAEPDTIAAAALLSRVRHDRQFRYDMIETGRALVADRLSQKAYAASLGPAFWASTGTENVPLLR